MNANGVRIDLATSSVDVSAIRRLFEAYGASLGIDLAFQDFAAELTALPGRYGPPRGALLLARRDDGTEVGCVGLRPCATPDVSEVKRLYVTAGGRGLGIGKCLARSILHRAAILEYRRVVLDTLPFMHEAIALYQSIGFTPIPAYYDNPVPGALFFERMIP